MHSYSVIRRAAEEVKQEIIAAAAASGEKLSSGFLKLKFSDHWIKSFLKRFRLSRQRITSKLKANRPEPEEVQRVMAAMQKALLKFGLCDIL